MVFQNLYFAKILISHWITMILKLHFQNQFSLLFYGFKAFIYPDFANCLSFRLIGFELKNAGFQTNAGFAVRMVNCKQMGD